MDFRARIPVEMWDEVFTHLPREDLRHVHLVDRLFHRLSTPLLFRTVTFHFDKIATPRSDEQYDSSSDEQSDFLSDEQDDSPAVVPPTPAEVAVVENALMRLEVWSSTSIAPLVRVCEIVAPSRCRRSGLFARPETGLPSPSRAFLHALPNFTNLREFTANQLRFTDVAVANLCLLPNLTKLVTRSCTIDLLPVDSFAFTLDLSHFTSWDNAFEAGAADQWVRALRPDTLQDLSIQQGLISNIIDLEYAFLRVKALTFALKGMDLSTIPGILLLLAKFPAAQTLKALSMPGAILAGMPSDVSVELPSIRNYTGPWGLLRFLPLSHLRYICITDCTFPDFISELRAIQVLHSVTSLEVDIQDYVENLDGLGELFPSLKSLAVWVDFSTGDVDLLESMDKTRVFTFFKQLSDYPSLPVNLKNLDIVWMDVVQGHFEFSDSTIFTPEDLLKLKNTLLTKHPVLTRLQLGCVDYKLFWERKANGKECCEVYRADDAAYRKYVWDSNSF